MSDDARFDDDLREALREAAAPGPPCPEAADLAAFYAGDLDEARAEALRDHLADCPECVARSRDARRFVDALRERPRRRVPAWAYGAAAAVAGIALLVALYTSRPAPLEVPVTAAPYPLSDADILWRGGEGPGADPLDAVMKPYQTRDYPGAVRSLEGYLRAHPGDGRARLYLGVSRLLAGDPRAAVDPLRAIADGGGPEAKEAAWYLSLALVRDGRRDEARPLLRSLAGEGGEPGDRARRLLRNLGE